MKWTRESIEDAIRGFAREHGRPPLVKEFCSREGLPARVTVERVYGGSVGVALAAAGFPLPERQAWTQDALVEWVCEFHAEFHRWPTTGDIEESPPRWRTFRRFWRNGLNGAITEAKKR